MDRHGAARNRTGLAIVGAGLLLLGLATLARGVGLLPGVLGEADDAVGGPRMRELTTDNTWFWVVVAAALVVVAVLALLWLLSQARTGTVRTLRLEPDPRHGTTTLPARAATGALEADLLDSPQFREAHAALTGRPTAPRLQLSATLAATADPAAARARLGESLDRQRRALAADELPTTVLLRTGR